MDYDMKELTEIAEARGKRIEELEAENARLREYALEVSRGLTGLTVGGSEFFATNKRFGFFEADITACVRHIMWRMDQRERLGYAKARAEKGGE